MKKNRFFFVFLFCFCQFFPQKFPEKGVPEITDYAPSSYGNKGKIWDIASSKSGILYLASEKGLLVFDGKTWKSYKGSKGFTRSVFVVNDSLIYTGSDMDFGVWKRNSLFGYEYQSLYPFKEKAGKESEEFWGVSVLDNNPVFVSHANIYFLKKGKVYKKSAPSRFSKTFFSNGTLFLSDEKQVLFTFKQNQLQQVVRFPDNQNQEVVGIYDQNKARYLVTKNSGLWKFSEGRLSAIQSAISEKLKKEKVFSFVQIDPSHLAFGTILGGLYITDIEGNIIHHINKQKGLLNNTLLSMHYDPSGNLWTGMDYGLAKINLKNRTNYFLDFKGNFGTGYSAVLKNDIFYLGTNQGLYKATWRDLNNDRPQDFFNIIPGSEGQVWSLKNVNDDVLIGHDLGLFRLTGNSIQKISNERGIWTIKPYESNKIFTGNYNGVSVFEKQNGNWKFVKK